ncbi:MAG: hypothetical protein ACK5MQ_01130 [Pikeienuella sp.]
MRRALALALLLAGPAGAAEPMSAADFRAAAEGWTLHFRDRNGDYFGSEQYLENGRTVWLPSGGVCERGIWSEDQGRICFLYAAGLSCWRLYPDGEDGIYAESADDGPGVTRIWLERRDRNPVLCPEGPGV